MNPSNKLPTMKTFAFGGASTFYRLSMKGKKATTLHPDEAVVITSSLTPSSSASSSSPDHDDTARLPNPSVAQSWKVSEDEYVIKVDASPLHMSAAQRLFGGKMQRTPPTKASSSRTISQEDMDDFIATIDDSPLHFSAVQRMFGGALGKEKKINVKEKSVHTATKERGGALPNAKEEENAEGTGLDGEEKVGEDWYHFWNNIFKKESECGHLDVFKNN